MRRVNRLGTGQTTAAGPLFQLGLVGDEIGWDQDGSQVLLLATVFHRLFSVTLY